MRDARQLSTPSKMALLGALYFSQGLPYGFFTQALPVLLRKQGLSLAQIGLSSLLVLPWALKFLWAPFVDRTRTTKNARFGRRTSWLIPLQFIAAVVLVLLALFLRLSDTTLLMLAFLLLNLIAATQDIASDGLAVDILSPPERGLANGLQVAGYRVGMIIGGGVLLILFDYLGSGAVFGTMALLLLAATTPLFFIRESASTAKEKSTPRDSGTELTAEQSAASSTILADSDARLSKLPARLSPPHYPDTGPHFFRLPNAMKILALVVSFKAGDAFATAMLRPFLSDKGFGLDDIGWLLGTVGFVSGLLGALVGGALVNRIGRLRSLLLFGLLQALSVAGYALITYLNASTTMIYLACAAEHFAGGCATAALFTCMMDWSRPSNATDYTVQASAVVIATGVASMLAGFSAQYLGYFGHFCFATGLALAALLVVKRCFPPSVIPVQGT